MVTEGVDPDALVIRKTSGSTGAPLVIRRSALEHYLLGILRVRDMLRCGTRFKHRRAVTSLMRSGDSRAQPMPADRLFGGMGLFRWVPLDCQDPVDQLIDQLRRIRPDAVMGFPGLVTDIAERLTESDRARIRPKLVVVGGETFTDDMRRRVREGFRANVYAAYTSHEFRNIAVDCPTTGRYHVCDESVIVELLRDGRPVQVGEAGEVVVTGLHSYAMPFIRYPLGDLAVRGPSPCGCGAPYAALEQVLGRVVDRFPLQDGRAILPYGLAGRINSATPWVLQFQVKQQRLDRFRIRLVAKYDPSDEAIARLREIVTGHFGEDIQVAFEFAGALSLKATGKFRTHHPLPLP